MHYSVDTNKSGEDGVNKNHQHSVVDGSDNPNSLSTLHDPEEDLRHIGSQFGKAGEGRGPCNVAEEDDKDNANEK
jgi:hypothetical protein